MENPPIVFHKIKTVLFYSVATVIIIVALAVSGLRLILTTANLYQEEVEQLASSLLEQPVKIGRMDAKLSGLMPTLIFHDVQVHSEKNNIPLFSLSQIDVGLAYDELIFQQEIIPTQITIRGMDLHVTRTVEGKYKIKGFDLEGLNKENEGESNSMLEGWLLQEGEIGLEDSRLTWVDEQNKGLVWNFEDINFLFKKVNERYQLLLSSQLPSFLGNKIELSLDLTGDITVPSTWDVKGYIESKKFNLSPIKKYIENENFEVFGGISDFKLWLDWENKKLKQLSGDLKLNNFSYQLEKNKLVNLNFISGAFDSRRDDDNVWNVSVEKFNYKSDAKALKESKFSVAFKLENENISTFDIKANHLKLETLSKIVIDNHLSKPEHEEILSHLNLHGEISDFSISWNERKLKKINAEFSGFSVNSWGSIPKAAGLSGQVSYDNKEGRISLLSENAVIGFPELFREEFKLDQLSADINFTNTREGLFFDSKRLFIQNTEVEAVSSMKLWLPKDKSSPHIDLQTYVSKGDISKVSHFLPVTIMSKNLVEWLDNSLVKGRLNNATVVLNGKLKDFPFDNKEGAFSVDVDVSGFTLKYLNEWPEITNANITGVFTGQGLKIHLLSGETINNILHDSYAEIKSYLNADLNMNISATGSSHSGVQYLVNSPVLSKSAKPLNSMRFAGDVATEIKINVPLGDEVAKIKSLSYSGTAKFKNSSVFMVNDKIDITGGSGTLLFTEKGLSSKNLTANILDEKSTFDVSSSLKSKKIKIAIKGKMKPGVILKRFEIPGAKNISGKTIFNAKMTFPNYFRKNNYPTLTISSNLLGVKSSFPEFLYKKGKDRSRFDLKTRFLGKNKIQFSAALGKHGSAIIELDHSGENSYLKKGAVSFSERKAVLPRENILYIDGTINKITPSKWLDALDLKNKNDAPPFFVNPVVFNLDKVNIFTRKEDSNNKSKPTNPIILPVIDGIVKKLYFDKLFLGRLDFKTSQNKHGLSFDEIILSAQNMKLFAHGDWKYRRGDHTTDLEFTLSSKDFGGMLEDLDFAAIIRKGAAQVSGKLKWYGTPTDFSLEKLNGDIHLKIKNGNIIEVDEGVGRLLGLFSLSALPRKLLGDFNNTFKSGFSFDEAEGAISIEDGDAYTDDFEISSPVADVSISGRTGLADRDYENTVEVVPDVGGGLAGITALLVNLPAGIGLWLVDKITGEQFNAASSKFYEISGSWESPDIEEVDDK